MNDKSRIDHTNPIYDIQISSTYDTVWIYFYDGSTIGRFSKRFGIDIHTTVKEQIKTGKECIYCTHKPCDQADWEQFCLMIKEIYNIDIPNNIMIW